MLEVDPGLDFRLGGDVRLIPDPVPGRFSFKLRLRRAPTTEERTPGTVENEF